MIDALYWFLALELFAFAALPLSHRVFARLPDRGLAFAKPLGLLSVGFVVWLIGLSHTIQNSQESVLLATAVVAGVSLLAIHGRWREIGRFLRANIGMALITELVFIGVFLGIALLRASTHDALHTEQPMDLMLLNSTIASPHYPPNDPWLAGETVSYYYLGYLMMGSVAIITGIAAATAYNLGLATAAAIAAIAAFGLTSNLVVMGRGSRMAGVFAGLASGFLLLAASNLVGALELIRASGAGSSGFWSWFSIQGLTEAALSSTWYPNDAGGWWWWRASRVIPGGITEFPAFSFVLGDMHPHVMSIGFVLLLAGIATQLYLQHGFIQLSAIRHIWPLVLVTIMSLSSLAAINLWDLPLGLALAGGAVLLNSVRNERRMQFGRSIALGNGFLVAGMVTGTQGRSRPTAARLYANRNGRWTLAANFEARDLSFEDEVAVAVATDDSAVAVAVPNPKGSGSVYVYELVNGRWMNRTTLRPPGDDEAAIGFGSSVSMSGNSIAVTSESAVYVFSREGTPWSLEVAFPLYPNEGRSANVVLGPTLLVVGTPNATSGAVHTYERRAEGWVQEATIRPRDAEMPRFGASLALQDDVLAVGAEGSVAIFDRVHNGWTAQAVIASPREGANDSFGLAVAMEGRYLIVGANGDDAPAPGTGRAFVFERYSTEWALRDELVAENTSGDAALGSAVAVRHGIVAASASGEGQGSVYTFRRAQGTWQSLGKIIGRWRVSRAAAAAMLLTLVSLLVASPFLLNFQSAANGVAPLTELLTRPVHLLLVWGVFAILTIPTLLLLTRQASRRGYWELMRFSLSILAGLVPVLVWLQPIYSLPVLAVTGILFGVHKMGYRLPRMDEALLAYNPRILLLVGVLAGVGGLLWDGIMHNERGITGELLAIDRLIVVIPMAIVTGLALYGVWTLANRDSERMRLAGPNGEAAAIWNGAAPALFLLATASLLVMGVELFHVSDIFGGDLRRQNTIFKLYYQAWILLSIPAGFGVWYVSTRWNRRHLVGRVGLAIWTGLLILSLGAVSYYPMSAIATRSAGTSDLTLDRLAYLEEDSPGDFALLQWVRDNTPRDAVVLESALVPCGENPVGCNDWKPELGRVASSTGRPTILGWEGHERQWRSADTDFAKRQQDVRTIYATQSAGEAAALLDAYDVAYVVVGPRERAVYGTAGVAKFTSLGTVAFESPEGIIVYEIDGEDAA